MRSPRLLTRLLPLGLSGVAGLALAGNWSDFKAAFPGLPCQDGWAGCIVDGTPVSPGMVLDAQGRPHPADMRLGFFEFDPLPSLSPFAALSAYTLLKDGRLPDPALPVQSWSRVMDDRPIKPGEDMMARWAAGQPKLLWWNGRTLTFDLTIDPGEQEEKPADGHPLLPELLRDAATYKAHLERTAALPLDPETVQSLQQLGYIH